MFATTLMLAIAFARANGASTTSQVFSSKPRKLMEALRTRLKENNYDYMSNQDSDETLPVRRENDAKEYGGVLRRRHLNEKIVEHYDVDYSAAPEVSADRLRVRSFYAPQTGDLREAIGIEHRRFMDAIGHKEEHLVNVKNALTEDYQSDVEYIFSKKDLVQPADEKNPNFFNRWHYEEDVTGHTATEAPKFKVLKVKSPSRRTMTRRRLIREESERGVAIVNLDQGPIPLFRLPRSRRQYMYNEDSHSTEESLPTGRDSSPIP